MGLGAGIGLDKPGGGSGLTPAQIIALFNIANVAFVDVVNGNNTTGEVGNASKPFLTLTAAQTAASANQLVYMYPGTESTSSALGKNGVSYYFEPGAKMTPPSGQRCFNLTAASMIVNVFGYGEFSSTSAPTISAIATAINCRFNFQCKSITRTTGGSAVISAAPGGFVNVQAYDSINSDSNTCYNENGTLWIKTSKIISGRAAISNYSTVGDSPTTFVDCDYIETYSTNTDIISSLWLIAGKMYVQCKYIYQYSPNSTAGVIQLHNAGSANAYLNLKGDIYAEAVGSSGVVYANQTAGIIIHDGRFLNLSSFTQINGSTYTNTLDFNEFSAYNSFLSLKNN